MFGEECAFVSRAYPLRFVGTGDLSVEYEGCKVVVGCAFDVVLECFCYAFELILSFLCAFVEVRDSVEDFLKDDVRVACGDEVFVYDHTVAIGFFDFFLVVLIVVYKADDCVFEFPVFIDEEPGFMAEYRVCLDFMSVVADEVICVFQAACDIGILVFDALDFGVLYTYIIYRGRIQDLLHIAGDLLQDFQGGVYCVSFDVHVTISCMPRH